MLSLILLCGSKVALAATHPTQLDANTPTAKCLECHEDHSKGNFVHSAIALGCNSCHEIRNNKDVTRIKLITATPAALCGTCHSDKKDASQKGLVHAPAQRNCLVCHSAHTADNKNLLRKPTAGESKENLCLNCHTNGQNIPAKGSRHAALDAGCDTCHTTHKVGEPGKQEFDYHLTKATPALCLDCHDAKDANLQKAHQGQPFATANCVTCHNPHQSDTPKLMQAVLHAPFADKSCDTCHAAAKDGKVVLTQPEAKTLCVTCHDEKVKQIETAKVPHPGAAGDCTDCHNPHASKTPGLPKSTPVKICLDCHSDQAKQGNKAHLHQPAFGQACSICHEAHGGDRPKLLRAKGNDLCLECHGPDARPQKLEAAHAVTIFGGKVKLPEDYYKKNRVVLLPLRYGVGHPTSAHPVQDILDATNASVVKTPLSCLSCHQPHASAEQDLLLKDQANNMAFCDNCHKNRLALTKTK